MVPRGACSLGLPWTPPLPWLSPWSLLPLEVPTSGSISALKKKKKKASLPSSVFLRIGVRSLITSGSPCTLRWLVWWRGE